MIICSKQHKCHPCVPLYCKYHRKSHKPSWQIIHVYLFKAMPLLPQQRCLAVHACTVIQQTIVRWACVVLDQHIPDHVTLALLLMTQHVSLPHLLGSWHHFSMYFHVTSHWTTLKKQQTMTWTMLSPLDSGFPLVSENPATVFKAPSSMLVVTPAEIDDPMPEQPCTPLDPETVKDDTAPLKCPCMPHYLDLSSPTLLSSPSSFVICLTFCSCCHAGPLPLDWVSLLILPTTPTIVGPQDRMSTKFVTHVKLNAPYLQPLFGCTS